MGKAADLTRDKIAAEALALLDEAGAAGMTMRKVGERLGVKAPSIYYHFDGQGDLIDAVHELIDSEIDCSGLQEPDWRAGLASVARSYRATFLRHPDAIALVARRPVVGARVLQFYEDLLASLLWHGMSLHDCLPTIGFLDYIVLGSAGETFIGGFDQPPAAYAETYPLLAQTLEQTDRDTVDEAAFEIALASWLDHVAARLPATCPLTPQPTETSSEGSTVNTTRRASLPNSAMTQRKRPTGHRPAVTKRTDSDIRPNA